MRTANRKRILAEKGENIKKQLKAMRQQAVAARRDRAKVFRKLTVAVNLNDHAQLAEVARMVSTPTNPVTLEDVARKAIGFYLDAVATDLRLVEERGRELIAQQEREKALAAEVEATIAPVEAIVVPVDTTNEAYTREVSPADSQIAEGDPVEKTAA